MNKFKNLKRRLVGLAAIFSTTLILNIGMIHECFASDVIEQRTIVSPVPVPEKQVPSSGETLKVVPLRPVPQERVIAEKTVGITPKIYPVPVSPVTSPPPKIRVDSGQQLQDDKRIGVKPIMLKPLPKVRPLPLNLSREEVNNYIQMLKSSEKIEDREYAATVLGSRAVWRFINDPIIDDVYNALAAAFKENTNEALLRSVALALGNLDRGEAGNILLEYLLNGRSATVMNAVVHSLGKLKYQGAVIELSRLLLNENDSELKAQSAWALGMIGNSSAGPALILALNDDDHKVKREAIEALGNLGLSEADGTLLNILNDEVADLELRESAARALRKIRK